MKTLISREQFSLVNGGMLFLSAMIFIFVIELLVFQTIAGVSVVVSSILLLAALLKPRLMYLLLISLFSLGGVASLPGASLAKFVGIALFLGLTMKMAIKRDADGIPQDNAYLYYIFFLVGGLISLTVAKNFSVSVTIFGTYLTLFIFYVLTRYFIKDMRDISSAMAILVFITLFLSLVFILGGIAPRDAAESRMSGGIGDSNEFAALILVLTCFSLSLALRSSGFRRIAYWLCVGIYVIFLILTASRGGLLGLLGSLGVIIYYYGMRRMREVLLLLLIFVGVFIFFAPEEYWIRASTILDPQKEVELYRGKSISTRMENYKASLKMFADNPIIGVGLYNFKFHSEDYGVTSRAGKVGAVVHNTYLEILTGGGLLSFIPFCLILLDCWRKTRVRGTYDKRLRELFISLRAAFVSVLISSFFLSADHAKITWFLLALVSSAYYIALKEQRIQEMRTLP